MKRALCGLLLVMCALPPGCADPRPPDAVALAIYVRNLGPVPHSFIVIGSHDPPVSGEAAGEPSSYGCGWVGRDWELIVTEGTDRPDPADEFAAHASGADFGNPDELALWIDVSRHGQVTIGEGVPGWWGQDIQRCP